MKQFYPVIILTLFLASCGLNPAFKYSQMIVQKETSLLKDIEQTESDVSRFIDAGQFDSIAASSARMEGKVDEKLKEVMHTPAPDAKGGESFKQASIEYFSYIKSVYTSYKKFGEAKTEEDREVARDNMINIANRRETVATAMQRKQKQFADANGFALEKEK